VGVAGGARAGGGGDVVGEAVWSGVAPQVGDVGGGI